MARVGSAGAEYLHTWGSHGAPNLRPQCAHKTCAKKARPKCAPQVRAPNVCPKIAPQAVPQTSPRANAPSRMHQAVPKALPQARPLRYGTSVRRAPPTWHLKCAPYVSKKKTIRRHIIAIWGALSGSCRFATYEAIGHGPGGIDGRDLWRFEGHHLGRMFGARLDALV